MYQNSYLYKNQNDSPYDDLYAIYQFIENIASLLIKKISDSKIILTDDSKRDIERVNEKVCKGELTIFEASMYLKEKYNIQKCMFSPVGISIMEYPNGD